MHTPCKAGCPSLNLQPSDVPLDGLKAPCMASYLHPDNPTSNVHDMQQTKGISAPQSKPIPIALNLNNGSILGPTLLNIHSNRPRPEPITHSPKHPTTSSHSQHEQSHSFPSRPQSRDGKPQTNLEQPVIRTFVRRDSELCPNTDPPPNSIGVEPGVANLESAAAA